MESQTSIFDPPIRSTAAVERHDRNAGIAYAVAAMPENGYDMDELRRWARHYCYSNQSMRDIGIPGVVWADKIRENFNIRPLAGRGNNWMGGLFAVGFEWTGEWYKSKTAGGHGNLIKLWRLKREAA